MSLLDNVAPAPRKVMTLFYVVDTSGSMCGSKIGSVNSAMEEAITSDLPEISAANDDAEIKVAIMQFSSGCSWITPQSGPIVKEFSEIASQQQKDGLNQVVQEFIRCMNESLRGQFDELAATIQKTCEWQKASTEQMQKIVDSICDTSNEIEKVNAVSHQTVEEMKKGIVNETLYQTK